MILGIFRDIFLDTGKTFSGFLERCGSHLGGKRNPKYFGSFFPTLMVCLTPMKIQKCSQNFSKMHLRTRLNHLILRKSSSHPIFVKYWFGVTSANIYGVNSEIHLRKHIFSFVNQATTTFLPKNHLEMHMWIFLR